MPPKIETFSSNNFIMISFRLLVEFECKPHDLMLKFRGRVKKGWRCPDGGGWEMK